MKILFLILLPCYGLSQHLAKFRVVLTPEIRNDSVFFNTTGLEEIQTLVFFGKNSVEITNTQLSVVIIPTHFVTKNFIVGRTQDGHFAAAQLLYMKSVNGKKMPVIRLFLDKEYLIFPQKPSVN
jgi:hypothetical protein